MSIGGKREQPVVLRAELETQFTDAELSVGYAIADRILAHWQGYHGRTLAGLKSLPIKEHGPWTRTQSAYHDHAESSFSHALACVRSMEAAHSARLTGRDSGRGNP